MEAWYHEPVSRVHRVIICRRPDGSEFLATKVGPAEYHGEVIPGLRRIDDASSAVGFGFRVDDPALFPSGPTIVRVDAAYPAPGAGPCDRCSSPRYPAIYSSPGGPGRCLWCRSCREPSDIVPKSTL